MKVRVFSVFILVVSITWLALLEPGGARPLAAQSQPVALALVPDRARVSAALRSAPLMFIENVGQFDQRARFQVRGDNATLYVAEDGLWVTVGAGSGHRLKLSFVGTNLQPRLEPFNRLDTHVSYFVGSDPANWRADVPVWGGVRYVGLYPGVDLEVTGDEGRWAWQLVCRADCQSALPHVRLRVEGADALSLDGDVLRLSTALGEYALPLLQVVGAEGANLASPAITGDQVVWPFASAIPNPQLVLSPVEVSAIANPQSGASDLLYSTFLGGSDWDAGYAIAIDEAGSAYVTGATESSDFPTTAGSFDTSHSSGTDVFVVKVNAAGTGLAYAAFLGGSDGDTGFVIAVDGAGSAYVTGVTESSDFPTTAGAFDPWYSGNDDAFVVKVNAEGTGLAYAAFLGGSGWEWGRAIAVDRGGSAYVTGDTDSSDFPTTAGAFDTSYNGYDDVFVVKVNAAGTGLAYATFLGGGSGDDRGYAIAVDGAANAYVTGLTVSPDFPTTAGAFDTSRDGWMDAFVIKVNAAGTGLAYATLLGGSDWDWGRAIAVDGAGSAYVTGLTESPDFPTTVGAFDTSLDGNQDAFVVKVNADGTGLAYATFLGGSSHYDYGYAIAVDGAGSAYVTGQTDSADFPTTAGAFDTSYNGSEDAFVVKVNDDSTGLAYATFLGGSHGDSGYGIAVDGAGSAYVTGHTDSSEFPTTAGAFDTSYSGHTDAFVVKISAGEVIPTPTPSPPHAPINGGFEGGFYLLNGESIANGWSAYTAWGQPTFAGERFTVHSGQWAYKIAGYAPFTAGLAQAVLVQPGTTYRVTAYYQLYPPGDGQALLGVQDGTSATQWVGGGWPGIWQPLSQEITVTSDRLTIILQGHNGIGLNTNVYFDDVTVVAQ
jgi:hypothetical protein